MKTRTNLGKSWCFQKSLPWWVAHFFRNEGVMKGLLCKKFFSWFIKMLVFIWNIAHLPVKNSKNVVKMNVSKNLCNGATPVLFQNEGGILGFLCKNFSILLTYYQVRIYLKHCTPHALFKLLEMWEKRDVSKKAFLQWKALIFSERKEGCKVPCVKNTNSWVMRKSVFIWNITYLTCC